MDKITFQYIKNACSKLSYSILEDKYKFRYFNTNNHFVFKGEVFDNIIMNLNGYTYSLYFKFEGCLYYNAYRKKVIDKNSCWDINEDSLTLDFQNKDNRTRTIFLTEEDKKELINIIRETIKFKIIEI